MSKQPSDEAAAMMPIENGKCVWNRDRPNRFASLFRVTEFLVDRGIESFPTSRILLIDCGLLYIYGKFNT